MVMRISSIFYHIRRYSQISVLRMMNKTNLPKHKITLSELHKEVLSTKGIVKLRLKVLNLDLRVLKLDEGGLVFR